MTRVAHDKKPQSPPVSDGVRDDAWTLNRGRDVLRREASAIAAACERFATSLRWDITRSSSGDAMAQSLPSN